MPFLPVVERELRVAARDAKLWWRRSLLTAGALAIFFFILATFGALMRPGDMGQRLFVGLGGAAMIYAMAAGPLTVADSLSAERRQGTLGLLFLTDLRSVDIVAGKVAAFGTDHLLVVLAALPILAISFLLGGLDLGHFGLFALSLMNVLFLSVSISLCVSAATLSSRVTFMVSAALVAFLTIGYPICGEALGVPNSWEPWFFTFCPSYSIYLTLDRPGTLPFWLNLIGVHLLAWGSFGLAVKWTNRGWREAGPSLFFGSIRERILRWNQGTWAKRKAWTERMLEVQPFGWMAGRHWLQARLLWSIILVMVGFWISQFFTHPGAWPDQDSMIVWPMLCHYAFCAWLASEAPRQLADDKESGALELLLCTPLRAEDIVNGNRTHLQRLFGRALVFLCLFYAANVIAVYARNPGSRFREEIMFLALAASLVIPLQARSIMNVALYEGVRTGNSLRATVVTLLKVGVLPWVLFVGCVMVLEFTRMRFLGSFESLVTVWAAVQSVVFLGFSIHAERKLRGHFRKLAGCTPSKPWWQLYVKERALARPLRPVQPGFD